MKSKLLRAENVRRTVWVDLPAGLTSEQFLTAINEGDALETGPEGFRFEDGVVVPVLSNQTEYGTGPFWSLLSIADGEELPARVEPPPPPTLGEELMNEVRWLIDRGNRLLNSGNAREARQILSSASMLYVLAGSPQTDEYMWLNSMLGGAHYALGHLTAGRRSARKAITFSERQYGANHPSTVIMRNNYAENLVNVGLYGEAEPLLRAGISALEGFVVSREYGTKGDWLMGALNEARSNLAKLLAATGHSLV